MNKNFNIISLIIKYKTLIILENKTKIKKLTSLNYAVK